MESAPSKSDREEFMRSHYQLIAGHATQQSAARWNYVQLSLLAVSVFYAWLFGRETRLGDTIALDVLVWMPFALAGFGGLQALSIRRGIKERNDVLLTIERHYGFEGWAHNVDRRWQAAFKNPFDTLVNVYWLFLLFFATAAALAVNTDSICLQTRGCG